MDEIYGSVINTIKNCILKSSIDVNKIECISIDGQMAGICSIDENWNTPTQYDSWLDTRCSSYIENLKLKENEIISLSGGPPTFSHGPKMLWWQKERPEIFKKISKFVMPSGYVAGKMAGLKAKDAFIDYTYIHFSCFSNVLKEEWSHELCEYFGFSIDKLPKIVKPWEIIGKVNRETSNITGLEEGTPIAAGCGDQAANMLGAGMNEHGMVFDVAGTASVFSVCIDRYVPDVENKTLFTARLVPQDLWYALAYVNGGGLNLRWFRDEVAKIENKKLKGKECNAYDYLNYLASKVTPGSENLFFIPHLGGRVCPNSNDLKGVWFGLTWRHKIGHLYRAILESIAYEYAIYLNIEKSLMPELNVLEARVIGGGGKSNFWNKIKADVLGIPYIMLGREEFGVLGSAILAGYATGVFPDLKKTADDFNKVSNIIKPDRKLNNYYKNFVEYYSVLLNESEKIFKKTKILLKN